MVIEPNSFNFDSKPMLDILDTRFNYFSFPVQITSNPIDVDVNFDFDNISAKYIIPVSVDAKGQPIDYQRINTSKSSTWYYNDGITQSRDLENCNLLVVYKKMLIVIPLPKMC
jgi:hypothetical protein